MVEIRIIVEGGAPPRRDTGNDVIVDNSNVLRQSINRIFGEVLQEEVSIVVDLGAANKNAVSKFIKNDNQNVYLYIDLDDVKANIPNWFTKLETDKSEISLIIPAERQQDVFFMIQEMEAWILKQPDCIDKWGAF